MQTPQGMSGADAGPVIRVSCPSCQKLYSVALSQIQNPNSATSSGPQFKCVACSSRFAVSLPVDLVSMMAETELIQASSTPSPMTTPPPKPRPQRAAIEAAPLTQTRECPKCQARNPRSALECRSCGIVFARYRSEDEERVPGDIQLAGSLELVAFWQQVLESYANEELHQKFVMACFEAKALQFASHKYRGILAVVPEDDMAKKMRKRIVGLASYQAERASLDPAKSMWRVPGLNGMAICLGTVVTLLGLLMPHARNLAGIGFSMLALAIAVRFVIRRKI